MLSTIKDFQDLMGWWSLADLNDLVPDIHLQTFKKIQKDIEKWPPSETLVQVSYLNKSHQDLLFLLKIRNKIIQKNDKVKAIGFNESIKYINENLLNESEFKYLFFAHHDTKGFVWVFTLESEKIVSCIYISPKEA